MITREDAVEILDILIDSNFLSDDINGTLHDVLMGIQAEKDGLHIWGIPDDDVMDLYTKAREEFMSNTFKERIDKLYQMYKFIPSEYEQELIDEELAEEAEDAQEQAERSN